MKKLRETACTMLLSTALCTGMTVLPLQAAGGSYTLYRLYNPNTGEHLFTPRANEVYSLISLGWRNEGKAWDAPEEGWYVYRMYNPNAGDHHYTMDENEKNVLTSLGWKYEGVEGKAWDAPEEGWYVYRMYNPNAGDHHYTMDENEKNVLTSLGWKYEGVGWASPDLGWTPVKEADGDPIYRLYNPNAVTASHHYTGSVQEANALLRLGWKYEGVGWYSLRR